LHAEFRQWDSLPVFHRTYFVFLMQFALRRVGPFVLSLIHLFHVCLSRCAPGYIGEPTVLGEKCVRRNGMFNVCAMADPEIRISGRPIPPLLFPLLTSHPFHSLKISISSGCPPDFPRLDPPLFIPV